MIILILFWIVPLIFAIVALFLSIKRNSTWRRAGQYGLAGFGLFLLLGTYAILQNRSSTAGLGFIFLPIFGLAPGLIGLALGKVHNNYLLARQAHRLTKSYSRNMIMLGVLLLMPFAWQVYSILGTLSKNKARDIESARQSMAINENTKELASLLSANPGKESNILSQRAAQTNDRTVLIPIAKNTFASADLLETLSRSTDFGVVLTVVRNKNTTSKTLEWIYKNHRYPKYFYVSLSGNPNTPDTILRELYDKRARNSGIAWNLARNPILPDDILTKLTHEHNKYVLRDILNRPHLSCEQVNNVVSTANTIQDDDLAWLMDMARSRMEDCKKATGEKMPTAERLSSP